jgi:poly-beta-1,6-N-acetyl-D-glucosamine synthase
MIDVLFYLLLFLLISPILSYLILIPFPSSRNKPLPLIQQDSQGVSIILPCYNEERNIQRKIHEILAECTASSLEEFELIIVSDGSTDLTNTILEQFAQDQRIHILSLKTRQGKPNALKLACVRAKFDWLIFSDARQSIQRGAFSKLLSHFSDPTIGLVGAQLEHNGGSWIRKCINYLKVQENKTGSTVGVYGALYAIKKSCFIPVPDNTVLDDLLISLQVLRQGKRVVFEPKAIAMDMEIEQFYDQNRIVRMAYGLFQLANAHYKLILHLPWPNIAFLYFQKYFKLISPFLVALLPALALIADGFYSLRFQITGSVLLAVAAMAMLLGYAKLKFVFRICLSYLTALFFPRKQWSVFWSK